MALANKSSNSCTRQTITPVLRGRDITLTMPFGWKQHTLAGSSHTTLMKHHSYGCFACIIAIIRHVSPGAHPLATLVLSWLWLLLFLLLLHLLLLLLLLLLKPVLGGAVIILRVTNNNHGHTITTVAQHQANSTQTYGTQHVLGQSHVSSLCHPS